MELSKEGLIPWIRVISDKIYRIEISSQCSAKGSKMLFMSLAVTVMLSAFFYFIFFLLADSSPGQWYLAHDRTVVGSCRAHHRTYK